VNAEARELREKALSRAEARRALRENGLVLARCCRLWGMYRVASAFLPSRPIRRDGKLLAPFSFALARFTIRAPFLQMLQAVVTSLVEELLPSNHVPVGETLQGEGEILVVLCPWCGGPPPLPGRVEKKGRAFHGLRFAPPVATYRHPSGVRRTALLWKRSQRRPGRHLRPLDAQDGKVLGKGELLHNAAILPWAGVWRHRLKTGATHSSACHTQRRVPYSSGRFEPSTRRRPGCQPGCHRRCWR
jgi:hypothetical protein